MYCWFIFVDYKNYQWIFTFGLLKYLLPSKLYWVCIFNYFNFRVSVYSMCVFFFHMRLQQCLWPDHFSHVTCQIIFILLTYSMWPKVLPHVKKNPYIINQNHIFSKNYCEVNFWIDFKKFYTKTFRIVYILIVYLLIMFIWVVFICT